MAHRMHALTHASLSCATLSCHMRQHACQSFGATLGRATAAAAVCRPPVSMAFSVPMFSASPLKVTFLKVAERSNYNVEKWVRKVCVSGTYNCRIK